MGNKDRPTVEEVFADAIPTPADEHKARNQMAERRLMATLLELGSDAIDLVDGVEFYHHKEAAAVAKHVVSLHPDRATKAARQDTFDLEIERLGEKRRNIAAARDFIDAIHREFYLPITNITTLKLERNRLLTAARIRDLNRQARELTHSLKRFEDTSPNHLEAYERAQQRVFSIAERVQEAPRPTVTDDVWDGCGFTYDQNEQIPQHPALLTTSLHRDEKGNKIPELWLPAGETALLVAPGEAGKSRLALQLALSVVSGKPFLNRFEVERQGPVLYVSAEDGANEVKRRLQKLARAFEFDPEHLELLDVRKVPCHLISRESNRASWGPTAAFHALEQRAKGKALVILDPGAHFFGPEVETDNAAAASFWSKLQILTGENEDGPLVLVTHHTNKAGRTPGNSDQNVARGSSAITDNARFVMNLERMWTNSDEKDLDVRKRCLRIVKATHVHWQVRRSDGFINLKLDVNGLFVQDDSESRPSCLPPQKQRYPYKD